MRIGICGGTFDPFHRGHLEPVLAVRSEMEWDRIIYVPAYRQPFKRDRENASGYDRFAMAVLATQDLDFVFVSTLELERGDISYTVDTLEALRGEHPNATLDWIIGDDNVAQLHEWKSIDRVFELANFVVLSRFENEPPFSEVRVCDARARGAHGSIVFAHNEAVPVSATEIRKRIRAGEPIDAFVDRRVSRYIHHYGLYQGDHREGLD